MPLTLIDRNTSPPGGYTYFQTDTRTRLTAATIELLVHVVVKHRQANNLNVGNEHQVLEEIEQQMCATMPPGICRDIQGQVVLSGRYLTWEDVKRGTAAITDWFANGAQKVPRQLAEDRARTCGSCFANMDFQGCTTCAFSAIRDLVEKAIGVDGTVYDSHLKSCYYCGCHLRVKCWAPMDVIQRHTSDEDRNRLPEHCWIKKEWQRN